MTGCAVIPRVGSPSRFLVAPDVSLASLATPPAFRPQGELTI
jgi:hypothetical protein